MTITHLDIDLDTAAVTVARAEEFLLDVETEMPGVEFGVPGPTGPPGPTGLVKVEHGADPNVPRPDAELVYWVGTVEPNFADPDDLLLLKEPA